MDENKRAKLKDIQYTIRGSCGLCTHYIRGVDPNWGECDLYHYLHLKHSGGMRHVSVCSSGNCPAFEISEAAKKSLEKFWEFFV